MIDDHPDEAKRILNEEIKAETTKALPQATLDSAWKRLEITHDPVSASVVEIRRRRAPHRISEGTPGFVADL